MKLSMRIRIARQRARLSQEALAQCLGVTRSAVANWECIESILPASARLAKLAEITGVSYEWLATGRGTMDYASHANDVPAVEGEMVYDELERRLLASFRRLSRNLRLRAVLQAEMQGMQAPAFGKKSAL